MRRTGCLLTVVLVGLFAAIVAATDVVETVVGCGGFVTASPDLLQYLDKKADYSFLKVELMTSDGILKHSTECSPNGYYFIPMYEKGSYVLRVGYPENWHFDPPQTAVNIGEDGLCNNGGDVNFVFTGFPLTGNVVVAGGDGEVVGPSGMNVVLRGHRAIEPSVEIKRETTTTIGGEYLFSNLEPGMYTVTIHHNTFSLAPDRTSAEVEVKWGNANVPMSFLITGFAVAGHVVSGGEPIHGVVFELFDGETMVAHAVSKNDGRFVIPNVSSGTYTIVPSHTDGMASFDLHPDRVAVTVSGDSVVVQEPFRVAGFSLDGHVLRGTGMAGYGGVAISVNGVEQVTDANGKYGLENLTGDEKYTIIASAPHVTFKSLIDIVVSPNMDELPVITPVAFDICGSVMLLHPHPSSSEWAGRQIVIAGQETYTATTDDEGRFCVAVPQGAYTVSPVLASSETAAGVVVAPHERRITVIDSPILDAHFKEARTAIEGRVVCITTPCDDDVVVTLTDGKLPLTTSLDNGNFKFDGVLPGEYELSVNMDTWCWQDRSVSVVVGTQVNGAVGCTPPSPIITQTGYLLNAHLSHDAELFFRLENAPESSTRSFKLTEGTNRFCVAKPGAYVLTPKSCVQFEHDVYRYDSGSSDEIDMVANRYAVSGTLVVDAEPSVTAIDVVVTKDDDEAVTITATRCHDCTPVDGHVVFNFTYWSRGDERLTIVPQATSSVLLFYPREHVINVVSEPSACLPHVPAFEGRPGLVLRGEVTPPLANVEITVRRSKDNTSVVTVHTGEDGKYTVPPLHDDVVYRVSAERDGYHFRSDRPGHFQAMQLGAVEITVTSLDGVPLHGVTLSMSGDGYRNNSATPASGTLTYRGLWPGSYFLRALLKEYIFEPATITLTIGQGEKSSVTIKGRRVAWSVYGHVQSLNGEPEKRLTVEAQAVSDAGKGEGVYEQTLTDGNGKYRLRGLKPTSEGWDGKYMVRVRGANVERCSPVNVAVTMSTDDVHGVDFVTFHKPAKHELFVIVNTPDSVREHVELVVKPNNGEARHSSLADNAGNTVVFAGLSYGEHLVEIRAKLSKLNYDYSTPSKTVVVGQDDHVVLDFVPLLKGHYAGAGGGDSGFVHPIISGLFIVAVAASVLFYAELRQLYDGKPPVSGDDDWTDGVVSRGHGRRKKRH